MKKDLCKKHGFTLIELLVTISIIAILMAITIPAATLARGLAKQMTCRSNLRSIGWAFRMYLDDNDNKMPPAANLPSAQLNEKQPITNFLKTYLHDAKIFKCPADNGIQYQDGNKSYFEVEGSSYWYEDLLGGQPVAASWMATRRGENEINIQVMYDYEPFHGPAGRPGSKSYLYADGHVGDLRKQN
jgi:prepilin-type N-terminal cleavage/methylation domain-containing protein/prepilin-type processing-associated H-X9-DG protein